MNHLVSSMKWLPRVGPFRKDDTTVPLPFYTSTDILPSDLPSVDEIHGSTEVLMEQTGRKVVIVGPHFVVKYGLQIDLEEGQTMIYIRKRSSLQVPEIYALFTHSATGQKYIIMERVSGATLQDQWEHLSPGEKSIVVQHIKTYLNELRAIPSPGFYCSVGNKSLRDDIFWTAPGEPTISGPFETEE